MACISLVYPWGMLFVSGGAAVQMMIGVCLANYLIFFGPSLVREARGMQQVATRRARFEAAKASEESLHRCTTCDRTEITHPDIDFRVAANGHEYCVEHLPPAV